MGARTTCRGHYRACPSHRHRRRVAHLHYLLSSSSSSSSPSSCPPPLSPVTLDATDQLVSPAPCRVEFRDSIPPCVFSPHTRASAYRYCDLVTSRHLGLRFCNLIYRTNDSFHSALSIATGKKARTVQTKGESIIRVLIVC